MPSDDRADQHASQASRQQRAARARERRRRGGTVSGYRRRRQTLARDRAIVAARRRGLSYGKLARRFRLSKSTVHNVCNRLEIYRRFWPGTPVRGTISIPTVVSPMRPPSEPERRLLGRTRRAGPLRLPPSTAGAVPDGWAGRCETCGVVFEVPRERRFCWLSGTDHCPTRPPAT